MDRRLILSLSLASLLLLAACGGGGSRNENQYYDPEYAKYFEGSEGSEMKWQMGPRAFYYSDAQDTQYNTFPISIEVQNKGASYTRGAVFLSGYDPNVIQIEGYESSRFAMIPRDACAFSLGGYRSSGLDFLFRCGDNFGVQGSVPGCGGETCLDSGSAINRLFVRGSTWFDDSVLGSMVFGYEDTPYGQRVTFGLDSESYPYTAREHGVLLIQMLSGLRFNEWLGHEYMLIGDTYSYPGGEIEYVPLNAHVVDWPEGLDEMPQTFLLTNCYMYTTFAAPMVCIDPQPYSEGRKACSPKTASWKSSQGAPVAITQVTQDSTPRSAIFRITVKNVGGGTVFDAGQLEKCSPYYPGGARASDHNTVWIGPVRIGDQFLDCNPYPAVRLQNGQATFTCTYDFTYERAPSAYQTNLVIELWYGYSEVLQKNVLIKRMS